MMWKRVYSRAGWKLGEVFSLVFFLSRRGSPPFYSGTVLFISNWSQGTLPCCCSASYINSYLQAEAGHTLLLYSYKQWWTTSNHKCFSKALACANWFGKALIFKTSLRGGWRRLQYIYNIQYVDILTFHDDTPCCTVTYYCIVPIYLKSSYM